MPAITVKPIKDFKRGDAREIDIQVLRPDGTPFNLTGSKVFFTVSPSNNPTDDSSAIIALKTSTFTNPTSGLAVLNITNAISQNITPGTYYYDVQVVDANGNPSSSNTSTFVVLSDISRSVS